MATLRSVMTAILLLETLIFQPGYFGKAQEADDFNIKQRSKRQGGKEEEAADFVCPHQYGLFADPTSCKRFFSCDGYHPYTQNCPSSLYFDDTKKFCTRRTKELICGPVETPSTVAPTEDPFTTTDCDPSTCVLPECFCSSDGTLIPGGLEKKDTPQMIFLSFDGAINSLNYELYLSLLTKNRTNPNGCPIKGTFFINHEYSSYFLVQKLYADGHEIAVNSISHRYPEGWWTKANYENYTEEMVGMREILHNFANISRDSILGSRAPFLHPGGNSMMSALYDYNFLYDSSLAVPMGSVPIWPYTLDHRMPHRCMQGLCPTSGFPGLWEMPLNHLFSEDGTGGMCTLADQCVFQEGDDDSVTQFLEDNFERHYQTNRAPLGLFFKVNWFNDINKAKLLFDFFDDLLATHKDVWFVTMQQGIAWLQDPTPLSGINSFEPWVCPKREPACNVPNNCPLSFLDDEGFKQTRYFQTCFKCPPKYPWVGNSLGATEGRSIIDLTEGSEK